jgi:hypothetical protein
MLNTADSCSIVGDSLPYRKHISIVLTSFGSAKMPQPVVV